MSAADYTFSVVAPVKVDDSHFVASSLPETDYPVYNPATPYALGERVIYGHVAYESLVAGNTGHTPGLEASATFWKNARATNLWRLFDGLNSSKTALGVSAYYELLPRRPIGAVALMAIDNVFTVRVRLTDPVAGLVYDQTKNVGPQLAVSDWWWWTFGERSAARTQALFLDLPPYYTNATLRVDFECSDLGGSCGLLVMGQIRRFGGGTEQGTPSRRRNFSYREFDPDFGDLTIKKRPKAREADFEVWLDRADVDGFVNFIDSRSDEVTLYIGTNADGFERLAVVGIPDAPEEENRSNYTICRVPVRGVI